MAQFGVAPFPVPRRQIVLQAFKLGIDALQEAEGGNACTNLFVKIGFRPLPIRTEESVNAVSWNWKGVHLDWAKHSAQHFHRRENLPVVGKNLGEVVPNQPEPVRIGIPGDKDDAVSCNTTAFLEAPPLVGPMMNRQDGEYDVESSGPKRQRLGYRANCRRGRRRALTKHYRGRLDSDSPASDGFVGAGSGTNVKDGAIAADQHVKSRGEPRIRLALRGIRAADRVIRVERRHPCSHYEKVGRLPNALVQLQARYNRCDEVASKKCLSAATFVRPRAQRRIVCVLWTQNHSRVAASR